MYLTELWRLSTATAVVRVAGGIGGGLVAAWADALRWPGGRGAGLGGGPGGGARPDRRCVRPGRAAGPGAGLSTRPAGAVRAQERLDAGRGRRGGLPRWAAAAGAR